MNANVIEVKPFNITKIELVALRGPKGETGYPTPEQVQTAVDAWLEDHPEATTTVQDGAITTVKLHDNAVTEDKLSESLQSLLITDTASGSIASFSDGSDGINVRELKVHIEPVQSGSGDPSPSNIRPITGWENVKVTRTGKNLLEMYGVSENGKNYLSKNIFAKAGTYTLSATGISGNYATYVREAGAEGSSAGAVVAEKVSQGNLTFTLAKDTAIMVQWYTPNDTSGTLTGKTFQLEIGSTATAYEAPSIVSITIPLGSTVYGGILDVTTGVLTVDEAMTEVLSTWAWNKSSSYPGGFFNVGGTYKRYTPFMCSHAKSVASISEYVYGTCFCDGSLNFRIMDANATMEDWKAFLDAQVANGTPVTICFYLATPTTVQLTAQQMTTLLGQNNIFADAGDVDVTYVADTKLYIAKMIANALNS